MGVPDSNVRRQVPLSAHSRDELLSKCETLQRLLDDRTLERDDLQRNVELLSMQSGNATFDFSSILSERLFQAESQLARLRTTSKDLENERDNLREDFVQFRQLKRTSDKSWKEVRLGPIHSSCCITQEPRNNQQVRGS